MNDIASRGWLRRFKSRFAAKAAVQGNLTFSELFVTKKLNTKKEQGEVVKQVKRRMLLNWKKSGVTGVSAKCERPELPRILDLVFSNLELMRRRRTLKLRHVVLDFSNAFYNFPNVPEGRRFFAAKLREYMYIWWRVTQGLRGAPLVNCRSLGLAMRLALASVPEDVATASTYVDDPIMTVSGDVDEQNINICIIIGCLLVMGF